MREIGSPDHASTEQLSSLLDDARAFDDLLGAAKAPPSVDPTLSARILAAAPRKAATRRPSFAMAGLALAACALVGVFVGYGAGTFVPQSADDSYLTAAFEAPFDVEAGGEG
mgnify:CR=1 FL=1